MFKIPYLLTVGAFSVSVIAAPVPGPSGGGVGHPGVGAPSSGTTVPSVHDSNSREPHASTGGGEGEVKASEGDEKNSANAAWNKLCYRVREKVYDKFAPHSPFGHDSNSREPHASTGGGEGEVKASEGDEKNPANAAWNKLCYRIREKVYDKFAPHSPFGHQNPEGTGYVNWQQDEIISEHDLDREWDRSRKELSKILADSHKLLAEIDKENRRQQSGRKKNDKFASEENKGFETR